MANQLDLDSLSASSKTLLFILVSVLCRCLVYKQRLHKAKIILAASFSRLSAASAAFQGWHKFVFEASPRIHLQTSNSTADSSLLPNSEQPDKHVLGTYVLNA